MLAKFYSFPGFDGEGNIMPFANVFLFNTCNILEYSYTKRWSKPGEFTMVLPFDKDTLKILRLNGIIVVGEDSMLSGRTDFLWIQSISYDGEKITITGKDLKGLLETRISLYESSGANDAGVDGYDVVEGTTAECIEHYLDNNCIDPDNEKRKLPLRFSGGADGLASDSYMARLECLSDIVTKLCDNADIGYDIRANISGSGLYVHTLSGTDRRGSQNVNTRAIFSVRRRNVCSQSFEHGVDDLYNAIYGTSSDDYTSLVNRDGVEETGAARRECNVSVSVAIEDSWFTKYVLEQVRDNAATHSYTIDVSENSGYGDDYILGDIVTVQDDFTGDIYNARITEVTKSISAGQRKTTITFGQQKQKLLQRIVNNLISGTQRRR